MLQHGRSRVRVMLAVVGGALLLCGASALTHAVEAEPLTGSDEPDPAAKAPTSDLVVYYFHGNFRCATCRKLEAYSEEAISEGFADELASGALVWRIVNTDKPENRHFVNDFELVTKALVLVEYRNGEVVRFENLKLVWQLVGNKDGFLRYVRDATRSFIEHG